MKSESEKRYRRFRLAWRWKESGVSGTGPWTHRSDLVEAWFESMARRSGERVEHWIEEEYGEIPSESYREMRNSERDRISTR
jgi:hypothetical protein